MKTNRKTPLISLLVMTIIFFFISTPMSKDVSNVPDPLIIEALSSRFVPVAFNHKRHVSYAACVECHHHTTGSPPSDPVCRTCHPGGSKTENISCQSCHPVDRFGSDFLEKLTTSRRYHIDIPGLQGAYHLNCLSCHDTVGAGPLNCQDCHEKQRKEMDTP